MAYIPHLLLAFGGKMAQTDTWSCTLRLGLPLDAEEPPARLNDFVGTVLNLPTLRDRLPAVSGAVQNYLRAHGSAWNRCATLDFVKLNPIGPNGRYMDESNTVVDYLATPLELTASAYGPPELAVAMSLRTNASRGLANSGRYFLPVLGGQHTHEGRMQSDLVQQYAVNAAAFIGDLNDWPGLDPLLSPVVIVASAGKAGPLVPGGGAQRVVRSVRVGDVIDIQHRRRRQLDERYVVRPV